MMEGFALLLSCVAIIVSVYTAKKSAKKYAQSQYYQEFNTRLNKLGAEIHFYHHQESEQRYIHYLRLISQEKNNHICNKDKQNEILECCTEIRRLLPKLSDNNTQNKNSILENIYKQVAFIDADIKDFCDR